MIKSFKQFLTEETEKDKSDHEYEPVEFSFGKHSQPKKEHEYEPVEFSFGKHSQSKKDLKEELILEAKSSNPTHGELVKHYKLNKENVPHVAAYTRSSRNLNNAIHQGKKIDPKLEVRKKGLDSEINSHVTPKKMIVHTGVGNKHPLHNHIDGKTKKPIKLIHKAFTSTSLNSGLAKSFAKIGRNGDSHSMEIHVPKGHHGIYVDHHSQNPGEREFILPRNTKLRVHPKPRRTMNDYGGDHYHWTAHVVK